ncbi:MAG: hypothetical protein AB7K68_08660 [Bacteriovoracia bacterium]
MAWHKSLTRLLHSLQHGPAQRVVFYYPGEEPTFVEDAHVTVFRNGMVEVKHRHEHVSTHIQNVEILWTSAPDQKSPGRAFTLIKSDISK